MPYSNIDRFVLQRTFDVFIIAMFSMTTSLVRAQRIELSYSVEEEVAAMTHVGHIVRDSNIPDNVPPDDVSDLRFSFLTEGNPDASYLWINSTSGEIKTATRIDREEVCRLQSFCELEVQAAIRSELRAFFKIAVIKVEIIDINDNAPAFDPSTFTIRISEREPPGAIFRLPTASDPDKGQGFSVEGYALTETSSTFSLIQERLSATNFRLELRLDQDLNREDVESYSLLLEAIDGGRPRMTGTLTLIVQVIDENDNSPIFEQPTYSANISEITALNSVVVTVKARDYDAGRNGEVTYVLPLNEQHDQEVFSLFTLNGSSGQIRTKIPLDSYAGGVYRLYIEARDGGTTPRTASTEVTIRIKDTHNSSPAIHLTVFQPVSGVGQVSEMAELGRTVAHVAVIDPDSGLTPNGIVSCAVSSNKFELQAIDVNNYKVILGQRLDREKASYHSVTVLCEDNGSPPLNASSNFMIQVLDENDNEPEFDSTLYTADVFEGRQLSGGDDGDAIVTVHASDKDLGDNAEITYRLAENSDSDFGIYTDGAIVVTSNSGLDREDRVKGHTRELVVLAVDGGNPALTGTTTVIVTIKDINDNAPRFLEPVYYFSVVEDSQRGVIVNNVSATDDDLEINGIFYFKMSPEDQGEVPFEVGLGGTIKVTGELDRETTSEYEFHVIAYDIGEPQPLSSTVLVHINIADINDNSPIFHFPSDTNNTLYIPHTLSANTGFGHLVAKDADEGRNGQLLYARDSGNGSKFFDIISDSGEIVLIRELSIKEVGPHILTVAVHDMGALKQMATQASLQIIVFEGNATLPYKDDGIGFRNIVVVVVLVVVTAVLGVAILLTILLIRRVDKQRRLYSAKTQEVKVDSKRNFSPVVGIDLEASGSVSDVTGDGRDNGKKKKEVSFSLDEDNNVNGSSSGCGMTSFGSGTSEKYDPILEQDRGKIKNEMILSGNHHQSDRLKKNAMAKKDVNSLTFHQVHPTAGVGACFPGKQDGSHSHEDNLSDVSGDVSTSDSGRGGSDVELQSHGGASKDSGDTSFISQPGFTSHNNLNIGPGNVVGSKSSYGKHPATHNGVVKSVHFQNIHPDSTILGSFRSCNSPSNQRPPRPQRPTRQNYQQQQQQRDGQSQQHKNSNTNISSESTARYTPNIFINEEDGSYVQLANRTPTEAPPMSSLHLDRAKSNSARFDNGRCPPMSRFNSNSSCMPVTPDGEYMDMSGARPFLPQRSSSSPGADGAWDGDTTTSGSYTVDATELCEEIDKLFFDGVKDVVV